MLAIFLLPFVLVSGIVGFPMDIDVDGENNNIEIDPNSFMADLGIDPASFPSEDSILTELLEPLEPIDISELVRDDGVGITDLEEIQRQQSLKNADKTRPTTPKEDDHPPLKIQRTSSLRDIFEQFRKDDVAIRPVFHRDLMEQQGPLSGVELPEGWIDAFTNTVNPMSQKQLFEFFLLQEKIEKLEQDMARSKNQQQKQPKTNYAHRQHLSRSPKDLAFQRFYDVLNFHLRRDSIYESQLLTMRLYRDYYLKPTILVALNATVDTIANNSFALTTALINFGACVSKTLYRDFDRFEQPLLTTWDSDNGHHHHHNNHSNVYNIFEFSIEPAPRVNAAKSNEETLVQQLAILGTDAHDNAFVIFEFNSTLFLTRPNTVIPPIQIPINASSSSSPVIIQILSEYNISQFETNLTISIYNKRQPRSLTKHENIRIEGRITTAQIGLEPNPNFTMPYRTKDVVMFTSTFEQSARLAKNIPQSGKSLRTDFFHWVLSKIAQTHSRELLRGGGLEVSIEEQTEVTVREMWKWAPGLKEEARKLSSCVELEV